MPVCLSCYYFFERSHRLTASLTFNFRFWSQSESELARICSLNTSFETELHSAENGIIVYKIVRIVATVNAFKNNFI